MFTPTTTPPTSVTAEAHAELTSRTPASFSDIPPILHWEDDAEVELASPNWTHWLTDSGTAAANGAASVNGPVGSGVKGRLYVTEAAVTFLPANLTGWTLTYPALTLHALTPAGERPAHIYCQIDENMASNANTTGEDEDEYTQLSEMRIFVAADRLESLFVALSNCSALHDSLLPSGEPSSFFGFGDDGDDDEWDGDEGAFEDADEGANGGVGRAISGSGAGGTAASRNTTNDDDDDADAENADDGEEDKDSEVDAIAAFLAKVDWGNVPPPSGWVDVDTDADATQQGAEVRQELEAARARVAYLERLLREEQGRVAELEEKVKALDGERFADQE